MKQKFKRMLSVLLAAVILASVFSLPLSASAESGKWEEWIVGAGWHKDTNTATAKSYGVANGKLYYDFYFFSFNGKVAYCCKLGASLQETQTSSTEDFAKYLITAPNLTAAEKKEYVKYALYYGYQGKGKNESPHGKKADEERVATQVMIWMINTGDSSRGLKSTFDKTSDTLTDTEEKFVRLYGNNSSTAKADTVVEICKKMKKQIMNHNKVPSCMKDSTASAPTHKMKYNIDTGYYEVKLTDTTGQLQYFDLTGTNDVQAVSNGDGSVTLRTKKLYTSAQTLTFQRKRAADGNPVYIGVEGWPNNQPGAFAGSLKNDPLPAYLKIVADTGKIQIKKTANANSNASELVSNIEFTVKNMTTGATKTVKTDGNGLCLTVCANSCIPIYHIKTPLIYEY